MENTVFILGAGASCTYGLPTGQRLAEQIIEVASDIESNATHLHKCGGFSENLKGILSEYYRENFIREKLELFAPAFKDFDYPSIDVFLNNTPEFEQIGKFLIAFLILIQEKKEYVNSPPPEYKDRSWPNWMNYLRQAIINNNMGDKSNQNISFVTFNYDRSLEYYLQKVLSRTFPKKEIHIDNYFDIIHVYGKLGNIRKMRDGFELADNDPKSIEYGDWKNVKNFDKAIGNIKLIYETRKNNELTSNISI